MMKIKLTNIEDLTDTDHLDQNPDFANQSFSTLSIKSKQILQNIFRLKPQSATTGFKKLKNYVKIVIMHFEDLYLLCIFIRGSKIN